MLRYRSKINYLMQHQLSYLHVNSVIYLGNNGKTSRTQTLVTSSDRGKFDHQLFHCFDSSFQRTIMELNGKKRFLEKSRIKFPTRKSLVLTHCLYDIYRITYLHRKLLKINAMLAPVTHSYIF